MKKPVVYNFRKAEDKIEELTGIIIRLNLELEYARKREQRKWNKEDPATGGTYLVAADTGEDEPYVYTTFRINDEWVHPDGWKILGWQELPKWEE